MKNLIQTTRSKIIHNQINLVSKQDLIKWADSVILELSEPPNYILDISIGSIPIFPEQLDIVRNPINSEDCADLLKTVKEDFKAEVININQVESICYQLALLTDGDISSALHWISDEIHLCNDGCKDFKTSLPEIKKVLNEITT